MDDSVALARHGTSLLIAPVVAFGLAVAVLDIVAAQAPATQAPAAQASPSTAAPTSEAAKAEKKVKKALSKARQAHEEREALEHFQKELAEYDAFQRKQLAKVEGQEPKAIQTALIQAIEAKRAKAEQGDIFESEVESVFRRLIAEQLKGPDATAARKAVREGNPEMEKANSKPVDVRVNAVYPTGAPLSTVPPSVLLTLPELPKSLNYRFVGRDLLLVDSVAQLIVDFLPDAAPALAVP